MCIRNYITIFLTAIAASTSTMQAASELNSTETLKAVSKGFSKVAKQAIPAVVYIESQTSKGTKLKKRSSKKGYENPFDYFHDEFFNRFFNFPEDDDKKSETVRGSGFVVSKDGYIVTNNHVVENATKVTVTFNNGKKMVAEVIGTDPKTDLAVIKVKTDILPTLHFGNSDSLDVGDWVIAVGNPFGLEASVTVGVVSAKGRNQLHITDFEDFIQTDAAINPGNSGGPLLNIDGEVIGINTAIVSGSGGYMGIGFAIPSNMASRIMDQLIKEGSVTRGYLGVTLQPIDTDLAEFYKLEKTEGALVTEVAEDSPAEKAGLKQEDVILSYNDISVSNNLSSFRNAVSFIAPGSKLRLKVMRDGKIKEIDVVVEKTPAEEKKVASKTKKLGLEVQNLTPEIAKRLGINKQEGIIISEVEPNSAAAEAEIIPGSLILAVNRVKVSNLEEFTKAITEATKDSSTVLLMVQQGNAIRFIALRLE